MFTPLSEEWGEGKSRVQKVSAHLSPLELRGPTHAQGRYLMARSQITWNSLTGVLKSWHNQFVHDLQSVNLAKNSLGLKISQNFQLDHFTKVVWVFIPGKATQKANLGLNKHDERVLTVPSRCVHWTSCHQRTHTNGWTQNCCTGHETLQGSAEGWTFSLTKPLRDRY